MPESNQHAGIPLLMVLDLLGAFCVVVSFFVGCMLRALKSARHRLKSQTLPRSVEASKFT